MTIQEALDAIDALRPNMYTTEEKLAWLSQCDGLLYHDVLAMRQRPATPPVPGWPDPLDPEGRPAPPAPPSPPAEPEEAIWTGEDTSFSGYDGDTDPATALLVPYPYDRDLYVSYLMMKVDESNAEIEKYNQSSRLFNNALLNYRNYVNRRRAVRPEPGRERFRW